MSSCFWGHDWHCFRLIKNADEYGFAVYDRVCLRCGKLRLDGTNGRKLNEEAEKQRAAVMADRDARAAAMVKGRIEDDN